MSGDDDDVVVISTGGGSVCMAPIVATNGEIVDVLAARAAPVPTSFSDSQLAMIFAAARTVPHRRRNGFLEAVARRIPPMPNDAEVRHAVAVVRKS